jgi:uncharacterized protein YndB with AHSA1/START domain
VSCGADETANSDEGNILTLRRVITAPRGRVFAAWLDPAQLVRFMIPRAGGTATAEVDARVGGRFRIVMSHAGGDTEHTGEYLVIDAPRRLSFTWRSVNTDQRPTVVTLDFQVHESGTELILTHLRLPPERIDAHRGGWGAILTLLDSQLQAA